MAEKIGKRFLWLSAVVSLSASGYLISNYWGKLYGAGAANVQYAFENFIPFVPNMIFVYSLLFSAFLLTPVFLVKRYDDFTVMLTICALLIFLSIAIFFEYPTTMARPPVPASGFISRLFVVMRAVDGECNLFPSLHVGLSVYVALVNGFFCPKAKLASWLCATLISVSTLLVKQHALIDVAGGAGMGICAYIFLRFSRTVED